MTPGRAPQVSEERPKGGLPLKQLIALTAAALSFFGCALLATIVFAGWSANQSASERERIQVGNALNRTIARTLDEEKSVAWWDDAITNLRDRHLNYDFMDANFGYFLTETYAHDHVFILNGANQPIYAFAAGERLAPAAYNDYAEQLSPVVSAARGKATRHILQRPDLFAQNQKSYQSLIGAVQAARWSGHILSVNGKPAIVTAITIVPNVNMKLLPAKPKLLVSIRYIGEQVVSDIGRNLLLPQMKLAPQQNLQGNFVSVPFRTDEGDLAGHLSWRTQQPGGPILTVVLPMTALGLFAAGLMFAAMFRRLQRASNDLAEREAKAQYAARHDDLSGLPNRFYFSERLKTLLSEEAAGLTAVFAYIDVDRFKDVNDTLGHRAGDSLIKSVASRLTMSLEDSDLLARFGGDEFAVLCASKDDSETQRLIAQIERAFDEPYEIERQFIRITASIGVAKAFPGALSPEELMRRADIALYRAKNQGRDQAIVFSEEMAQEVEERRAIELDLREALKTHEQLSLHYQPIVSCSTQEIVGLEALLRWKHPTRGDIGPSIFVPIAEDSGLMPALGEWILNRAMQDSNRWPELDIAINLSPVQIRHMDLPATLKTLIERHNVDPTRIVLEITEGVLLEDNERSRETLSQVRAMGFKTSLDDFGTGYSSLAYLCKFQFDKIKIDRSFVTGKTKSDATRSIVQAVATLGRGLGLTVIAEGVETEADALMVKHLGCTEMQGYLFSKAVSADELDKFLAAFNARDEVKSTAARQLVALRSF